MQDALLIMNCTKCGKNHFYGLEIQRMVFAGANATGPNPKKFSRIFTCPIMREDFKVTTYLFPPDEVDFLSIKTLGLLTTNNDLTVQELKLSTAHFDELGLTQYLRQNGFPEDCLLIPPGGIRVGNYNVIGIIR